ncbi:MAG: amidohydrolase family protein [Deltaproteobacteria bacterium]|jgi:imidazolonepropionase-like amidohydrolase|nr:amidohydrolase family protein [Deltaproteobacteria bacterium]
MKRLYLHLMVCSVLFSPQVAIAESTIYRGATVHTLGPAGTLENATVVVRDGRFAAVGADVELPSAAGSGSSEDRVIDASGKIITPGFFSAMGQLGLTEVSGVDGTVDYYQTGERFSASFDIAEAYNHRSTLIAVNRAGGITRALTAPAPSYWEAGASSQVFSGLAAVVQLGERPDFVAERQAAMVVSLGEAGSAVSGGSRAAAMLALRTGLDDAVDYRRNKGYYERGQRREYSLSMADLEALQPVLAGDTPLLAHVNRASDIEALLKLAAEYRVALIIYGGAEAWMVADALAAARVPVILDSKSNLPSTFDALNARLEAPAILVAAGVAISFGANWQNETYAARNIAQSAGNAVANGLPWMEGLKAITLSPARMYRVDDRYGSIEVGKEADLIVWSADPLELTSNPEQVMIRGELVSLQNRQTLLRDRYMQIDSALPPAWRR